MKTNLTHTKNGGFIVSHEIPLLSHYELLGLKHIDHTSIQTLVSHKKKSRGKWRVCIPQVFYLKGVYIMCWILIGPMSNQPAMFPLPHGFLGKSFPYLGILKTLKRGGREEREMGYGRPFLTRPSLNEICTDYFLMMAHPLPPITHFHSNSEVTHMLLARHSFSLVCANSQRDFFTNCTSIWSLSSFLTTCWGCWWLHSMFSIKIPTLQCQIHPP